MLLADAISIYLDKILVLTGGDNVEINYDELIKQEQQNLEQVKAEMEKAKNLFIDKTANFLKQWFSKEARNYITNEPEKSASLSNETLSLIKNEVNSLIEKSETLVKEGLNKEDFWWHIKENSLSYPTHVSNVPQFIEDEIKFIMGKLGQIFANHNFFEIEIDSLNGSLSSDYVLSEGRPKYRFTLTFEINELRTTMQDYGLLCEKAKNIIKKIADLELEKKKSRIGEIWDSL